MPTLPSRRRLAQLALFLPCATLFVAPLRAQDPLRTMPGYDQYRRVSGQIPGSMKSGALTAFWKDSGAAFEYQNNGKNYRYDVAAKKAVEIPALTAETRQQGGRGPGRGAATAGNPARGRQFESALSPDGKLKAFYKDRNLYLSAADGSNELAVTSDGSEKTRVKNGTASWVYGEELRQTTAFWWSPDGSKLAYYRFDESGIPDYFLALDQTKLQSSVDAEAYPKPGVPNPVVDLFVYDVATKATTKIDVRDGKPFDNVAVGHYVYHVAWSPDGKLLTFNRTNRRQNILELTACEPATGKCRAVIHEEWPTGWVQNIPTMQYLSDGNRFIWESERTGFSNYYLYDLSGKLLSTLTNHQ